MAMNFNMINVNMRSPGEESVDVSDTFLDKAFHISLEIML